MNTQQNPPAQPSEIQAELLAMAGSAAGYHRLLDNLQEQMRQVAQKRGKIDLNLDIFAPPVPSQPAPGRKGQLTRSGARPQNGKKRVASSQRKKT